jgi:HlyD family secretion protein
MKKKKKIIIWVLVLLLLGLGGFLYSRNKQSKTNYTTSKVERGDLSQTVSVTGEIMPTEEVKLAFKASGIVEEVFVDVGDKVSQGQK